MKEWEKYQQDIADLFRNLGCKADVDQSVKGARGTHKIDVWVTFSRYGMHIGWAVECKCWKNRIPKEKVMALKSIVEDIGADRGVLMSEIGFQSGAVKASAKTNVTLTSLANLRQSTKHELFSLLTEKLDMSIIKLHAGFANLLTTVESRPGYLRAKWLPGVDHRTALRMIGILSHLTREFERIRLSIPPPFLVPVNDDSDSTIVAGSADAFIELVGKLVLEAQAVLDAQPTATGE